MNTEVTALVRDGYDLIAEQYLAQAREPRPHPRHEWLSLLLERLGPAGAVLDLGCGAGVPTGAAIVSAGHRLVGIDISPRQVELARKEVPAGNFVVADATETTFEGSSFDAVVALYCISHMPRDRHAALFASIHDWLKPDGWFLTCLGTRESTGWLEEDFLGYGGTNWTNSYDREQNRALLMGAGFSLERAEIVEVDEPNGLETWFWVLARRHRIGER